MRNPGGWSEVDDVYEWRGQNTYKNLRTGATLTSVYSIPHSRSRTGYNSGPGWQEKKANGTLPPTPASLRRSTVVKAYPAVVLRTPKPNSGVDPASFVGYSGVPALAVGALDSTFSTTTSNSVINDCKMRLIQNIKADEANVLEMVAEATETRKMLLGLSWNLLARLQAYRKQLARDVAKGTFKSIDHVSSMVASRWLEFHFGIEPLISDIEDLYNVFTDNGLNQALTSHVKAHAHRGFCKTVASSMSYPFFGIGGTRIDTYTRSITSKRGLTLQSMPFLQGDTNTKLGLRAENIVPALYELMPYSWAVDYFTNIGDLIEAYTYPMPAYRDSWSVLFVIDKREWECSIVTPKGANYVLSGSPDGGSVHCVSFNRDTGVDLLPSFEFYNWDKLTQVRTETLVAAAYQFARGKLTKTPFGWWR